MQRSRRKGCISFAISKLGLLFSINQIVYLLIAMWVYNAVPDKMLMVFAMIFGAHLMPYSWHYDSKSYLVLSILIPIMAQIVGLTLPVWSLATIMVVIEILFSIFLSIENGKLFTNAYRATRTQHPGQ